MNMRNPLANARGLGAAKDGVSRWWLQRLTAVAIAPLTLWFVFSVAVMSGGSYHDFVGWLSQPWVAVLLIIYLVFMFYHSQIGLQEVCEDYIHSVGVKMAVVIAIKLLHVLLGVATVLAVLKIAVGGA